MMIDGRPITRVEFGRKRNVSLGQVLTEASAWVSDREEQVEDTELVTDLTLGWDEEKAAWVLTLYCYTDGVQTDGDDE